MANSRLVAGVAMMRRAAGSSGYYNSDDDQRERVKRAEDLARRHDESLKAETSALREKMSKRLAERIDAEMAAASEPAPSSAPAGKSGLTYDTAIDMFKRFAGARDAGAFGGGAVPMTAEKLARVVVDEFGGITPSKWAKIPTVGTDSSTFDPGTWKSTLEADPWVSPELAEASREMVEVSPRQNGKVIEQTRAELRWCTCLEVAKLYPASIGYRQRTQGAATKPTSVFVRDDLKEILMISNFHRVSHNLTPEEAPHWKYEDHINDLVEKWHESHHAELMAHLKPRADDPVELTDELVVELEAQAFEQGVGAGCASAVKGVW